MVLTGRANNNNLQLLLSPDLSAKILTVEYVEVVNCYSYSEADTAQGGGIKKGKGI